MKKWTKLHIATPSNSGKKRWLCRCDCGYETAVLQQNLNNGSSKMCGRCSKLGKGNPSYKHGNTKDRLYSIWKGIKARCTNPNNTRYEHYGGRNISYADEWVKFEAFRVWAEQSSYSSELTIDRIDVNGNYEPSNCQWLTREANTIKGNTIDRRRRNEKMEI